MLKSVKEVQAGDVVKVPEELKRYYTQQAAFYTGSNYRQIPEVAIVSGNAGFPRLFGRMYEQPQHIGWPMGIPKPKEIDVLPPADKEAAQFRGQLAEKFNAGDVKYLPPKGTTGTDPEIFLVDEKENLIPAFEVLGPKRDEPVYWDGFQAELTTEGYDCQQQLREAVRIRLDTMLNRVRAKRPTAQFSLRNVVDIPEPLLLASDMKYVELGCAPSFNAYDDKGMPVGNPRELTKRFAGGHLHYGITGHKKEELQTFVKVLDMVLGVAGVSLAAEFDDPFRRLYYGKAGEFRTPKHGLEYRVLSNFWLIHPAVAMLVWELFRVTIRWAQLGLYNMTWKWDEDEVRSIINNCDVEKARRMLVKNAKTLEALFKNSNFAGGGGNPQTSVDLAMYTTLNGIEALKMPHDVELNWCIGRHVSLLQSCRDWALYASVHQAKLAPAA